MKRILPCVAAFAVAGTAFAAKPTASIASVSQKGDSARTLKIEYTLAGGPAIVTVEFFTNATGNVSLPFGRIEGLSGDANKLVDKAAGTIAWPVRNYLDGVSFPSDSFRVKLTAWPLSAPPPWCVVDPGEPGAVAYYADESLIPLGGLENDLYKTRYIPMRRIDAAGVEWTMGMSVDESRRFSSLAANGPAHAVALSKDYYMSIYEFTRGQYKALNDGTAHSEKISWLPEGENEDELPLAMVSFSAMRGLGKRWPSDGHEVGSASILQRLRDRTGLAFDLPTEAQWEFACRAGTRSDINSGKTATVANGNQVSWNYDNSLYSTMNDRCRHRVGQKLPNAWGLYDMHGNVWEICLDRHPGASSATYWTNDGNFSAGSDVIVDPIGPSAGSTLAMRGGSCYQGVEHCRSAFRYYVSSQNDISAHAGEVAHGYRLVCPIPMTME